MEIKWNTNNTITNTIMSRLSEIYDGWKNYIFPNPEIEKLAKARTEVCITCESLHPFFNTCALCSCPNVGKTRSPHSICLLNKWKDVDLQFKDVIDAN